MPRAQVQTFKRATLQNSQLEFSLFETKPMGPKMKRFCLLLAPALVLGASGLAAKEVTGTVTLQLKHLFGRTTNGARKPSADKLCRTTFGYLTGNARTTYKIDPQTLIMSAETTFHSTAYDLNAIGLSGKYAFAFRQSPIGRTPPVYLVNFAISLQFTNPHSNVGLSLDPETNCQLTDSSVPGTL
jgi:hypothetical protein